MRPKRTQARFAASQLRLGSRVPGNQMSAPVPRLLTGGDRGYMNHPAFGAALMEIDPQTNTPPSKKLSRTKAPNRETAIRGEHGQDQMLRKSARTKGTSCLCRGTYRPDCIGRIRVIVQARWARTSRLSSPGRPYQSPISVLVTGCDDGDVCAGPCPNRPRA